MFIEMSRWDKAERGYRLMCCIITIITVNHRIYSQGIIFCFALQITVNSQSTQTR